MHRVQISPEQRLPDAETDDDGDDEARLEGPVGAGRADGAKSADETDVTRRGKAGEV